MTFLVHSLRNISLYIAATLSAVLVPFFFSLFIPIHCDTREREKEANTKTKKQFPCSPFFPFMFIHVCLFLLVINKHDD